jgi:hypothetical protein
MCSAQFRISVILGHRRGHLCQGSDQQDAGPCHEPKGGQILALPDRSRHEWEVDGFRIFGVNLSERDNTFCSMMPFTGKGRNEAKGWWRLVWCHERCHKEECAEQRQDMSDAAQEYDGSLVCLKKADKFTTWLEHALRPPYILLTTWREAQPCMQAVARTQPQNKPRLTIVHCEGPRQFARATNWARTVSSQAGPILVSHCETQQEDSMADLVYTLLNGLKSQLLAGKQKGLERHQDPLPECNVQQRMPLKALALEPLPQAPVQEVFFEEESSDMMFPEPPLKKHCPVSIDMTSPAPLNQNENFNEALPDTCSTGVSDLYTLRVRKFLSQICATYDQTQLERVLACAMPNHYED